MSAKVSNNYGQWVIVSESLVSESCMVSESLVSVSRMSELSGSYAPLVIVGVINCRLTADRSLVIRTDQVVTRLTN